MLRTLVTKELLNNLLNLRFSLAYFLCSFLLVGSASVMFADFIHEKNLYEVNQSYYTRRMREATRIWHYIWHGKVVVRRPSVLKVLATGGEKDPDPRATVNPEFSPYFNGDFQRNPLTNLFPTVDMVFIIGVIVSLLIFMLTYDGISGERDEGTLKVVLSCPVPRDRMLIGKWLGGFLSLIIPFVTSWLLIMILLLVNRSVSLSADDLGRMIAIFMVSILYVAVVFSLSLMVSAMVKRSATAILTLLFVWVVFIVMVPSLSTPAAYLMVDPPGVQDFQVKALRTGVVNWIHEDEARTAYLKDKFGVENKKELGDSDRKEWERLSREFGRIFIQFKIDTITAEGRNVTRYENRIAAVSRWIARMSPYGCLQNACVVLANTGIERDNALKDGLEEFMDKSYKYGLAALEDGKEHLDPSNGPQFAEHRPALTGSLARSMVDIGILAGMGVLFFMAAYLGFLRSEIV